MFHHIMSNQEVHNAKIENSISAIKKFSTKNNIGWILDRIGGVNSKILSTEYLRIHDPSLIGGTALQVAYNLDELTVFEILLDHGADITLANQHEKTVAHLAFDQFCPKNTQLKGGKNKYADLILTHHVNFKVICNPCDSNGISHFHIACISNHIEAVKFFINNGISVDQTISMDSPVLPGYTPLHLAVTLQHLEVVKILLDYNADANLKEAKGDTALHIAFQKAQDELRKSRPEITSATFLCASLLLNNQGNYAVNPINENRLSHFHIACCMNNSYVVQEFLKHCVNVNEPVNFFFSKEEIHSTPLHLALKDMFGDYVDPCDRVETTMVLLKYGASLSAEDAYCNTPLHILAKLEIPDAKTFLLLIEAGADVNARNLDGQTALEILMSKRVVQFDDIRDKQYLRQFSDEFDRDEERQRRVQLQACYTSLLDHVTLYLVEYGYHFNSFNPIDEKGCLAQLLHWSRGDLLKTVISKMMRKFPNLLADEKGRSIIHNICSIEFDKYANYPILQSDLIRGLPQFGYDMNTQDKLGRTALHMAAQFQNQLAFGYLLTLGTDVNIADAEGRTAIEYAFKTCNLCDALNSKDYGEDEKFKHDTYEHRTLLFFYVIHVKRLQYCGLDVSRRNREILNLVIARRDEFEDAFLMTGPMFWKEIDILRDKTKGMDACLGELLSETDAVAEYPYMSEGKRRAIDEYFGSGVVYRQFRETAALLNLQYYKAMKRKEITRKGYECLVVLFGIELPVPYFRRILRALSNWDIKNLIAAVNVGEST